MKVLKSMKDMKKFKEEFKQKANEEGYIDVNMTTTNGMNAVLNDDMPF